MLPLIPLPGDGRFYCGPAAIASFTGLHPKEEVRSAINQARGFSDTQGVIGLHVDDLVKAFKILGFNALPVYVNGKLPMLKDFIAANPNLCGVANVTRHYIAVSGNRVQDNQSGAIYPLRLFSGQRKRVSCFIHISKS